MSRRSAPARTLLALAALLLVGAASASPAHAQDTLSDYSALPSAAALLETPTVYDDDAGANSDSDDPAIWVHPWHRRRSLVVATKKNGGLDVFDLQGRVLQTIATPIAPLRRPGGRRHPPHRPALQGLRLGSRARREGPRVRRAGRVRPGRGGVRPVRRGSGLRR